jgi:UDP-N-acetylmuramyl pentapeptide phosphotransferase/UDP-N-acetylglucosamine-1-phosphate transferase
MLSSHRAIALGGVVIFMGSVVSYWMYWNAFTSVWCFFAAITSALVILHFERARRTRLAGELSG